MDQRLIARPRLSQVIESVIGLLEIYNERLYEIQDELRFKQPRSSGATLLYLTSHSEKQPTCFLCPHMDWKRTGMAGPKGQKYLTLRRIQGNPVMKVRRRGQFLEIHDQIQALISEAVEINEQKKKYSKILGNLSRMVSYRFYIPEFGERLTTKERGMILKEHIIMRLDDIDHSLQRWSQQLEELQPGQFPRKLSLEFNRCSRGCDFCLHPYWLLTKKVKGESTLEKVRITRPLPSLPRNTGDPERMDQIREIVRKVQALTKEREGYSEKIFRLRRTYRASFELA